MSLAQYKQKRRFDETPEPAGKVKKAKAKQLEFVIQKHQASRLHYDFRLEMDGVLKSWAVPKGPSLKPGDRRLAMMVEDHPYEYRKFEGTIPKGNYGAGSVIVWDRGWYELDRQADNWPASLAEGLKKGELKFILHGEKLGGSFALVRTPSMGDNAWLLIKHKDEFASDEDVTQQDKSVISGRRLEGLDETKLDLSEAPRVPMPTAVKPMLATLADQPFDDPDWLFEIKWDGYRAIGSWDGKTAELYSRNGQDFSKYKEAVAALRRLDHKVVLDGEVVAIDEAGRSNFGWLQNYTSDPKGRLVYYVFDILWCDGHDLTGLPLESRKAILEKIVPAGSSIIYSSHVKAKGRQFFNAAANQKLEGIMAKDGRSNYKTGLRSGEWLKVKTHLRQETVIGGFTEPKGSRKYIGALILGVYEGEDLVYVGHAGGGIPSQQLPDLRRRLEKIERPSSPFSAKIKPNAPVHWVEPHLLAEVTFSEWTADKRMRQPIFIGLREDKPAKAVKRELPKHIKEAKAKPMMRTSKTKSKATVEFSHLDKVFFPKTGITKGDLIDYYRQMGERMLPYIKDRPHSLLRQPNGIGGQAFFQKDFSHPPPAGIKTTPIYSESNQKEINYLVCDSVDSLLYMVQLGCIEINPWNSRLKHLAKPDWVVIDLDPEDISFDEVIKVAQVARELCQELKIPAYPKTSGKTGIHIFMPLNAKYDYEQAKQFGQLLATLIQQRIPETTSLVRSPTKRQGKIYIDFLQNREGQTLSAAYSVRPTEVASVSAPLHWDEIKKGLDPSDFTLKNIFKRLDSVGELWYPVVGKGIDLAKILKSLA
jgi:bifunctional non-homologous end joining protein LigD